MSRLPTLSTTSYGVLGLLAVRPYSSYELAKEMSRSVGRLWPRATSKLYEEPKKLAAHGLATSTTETVGRRARTVYTITPEGRRALAEWLDEPGAGPTLEFEGLLKLIFAEHGSTAAALATIERAREWAVEQNEENIAAAEAFLRGEGRFGERASRTILGGRFLTDFYALVAQWADWAEDQVRQWPDDVSTGRSDPDEIRAILERALWSRRR